MRRLLIILLALLPFIGSAQDLEQPQASTDSVTQEQKEFVYSMLEQVIIEAVDSLIQEGMYMQALESLDNLKWEESTGLPVPPRMYMLKAQIYLLTEEWQQLVNATDDCIKSIERIKNSDDPKYISLAALCYSMQGNGYRYINEYKNAIRSYEKAIGRYNDLGDLGYQGELLCNIAYCYDKLDKPSAASSFYKKGLSKFLQYFNKSKENLLQNVLIVDDSYKQAMLDVFGTHLLHMAVFEENCGDRESSKDYLLMSAHCGNPTAKSEYKRIYGY